MKFFFPRRKLSAKELLLVPEAFWEILIARIKVSYLPSSKYLHLNCGTKTISPTRKKLESVKLIASTINGLSSRTPFPSTCLVKVLAAHKLLEKRNISHTVHFGVKKDSSKVLNAHAWLSVANEIIIGGGDLDDFNEISRFSL